jgi:DNA-binding NtrC family response regulator
MRHRALDNVGMNQTRICVIEDNDDFRSALVDRLSIESYQVQGFAGLGDFFAALRQGLPDIIISDVDMDGGDGFELLDRLQASGLNIPVILMSGINHFGHNSRARDSRVRAFLLKPFEISHLLHAIEQV